MRVGTKRLAAVPEVFFLLLNSVYNCEQQLDWSVFEHDQRDVTDGMETSCLMWPRRIVLACRARALKFQ